MPRSLLPTATAFSTPSSVASSLPSSPPRSQQSASPRLPPKPTNFQDVLVFDPSDGTLSLRRVTVLSRVQESGTSLLSAIPISAGTSVSLPGMGFMGRFSSSPPKPSAIKAISTSTSDVPLELVGKDSTVATYSLLRSTNWEEVKVPLSQQNDQYRPRTLLPKSE